MLVSLVKTTTNAFFGYLSNFLERDCLYLKPLSFVKTKEDLNFYRNFNLSDFFMFERGCESSKKIDT
jgi:hypothetical protein